MRGPVLESEAKRTISSLLEEWLGEPVQVASGKDGIDLVVTSGRVRFLVDVKGTDQIASIEMARAQLEVLRARRRGGVPLLAVPYMGPKARERARSLEMSWMDLSGNADIRAPGMRILVKGQPNLFVPRGRPSSIFSSKASRLSRVMLIDPDRWWRRSELAATTKLSAGFVTKIVQRMLDEQLVTERAEDTALRPRTPSLLLDAWAQQHRFPGHHVRRFHAVGRSGPAVLQDLAPKLEREKGLTWAATGLAAAWMWTRFADFRLVTIYVSRPLEDAGRLDLQPIDQGANVWVVVPDDAGVFHASSSKNGVECVHPVQAYLDLLDHPERAKDAAAHLRSALLNWRA